EPYTKDERGVGVRGAYGGHACISNLSNQKKTKRFLLLIRRRRGSISYASLYLSVFPRSPAVVFSLSHFPYDTSPILITQDLSNPATIAHASVVSTRYIVHHSSFKPDNLAPRGGRALLTRTFRPGWWP